jgi:hypothetical protein
LFPSRLKPHGSRLLISAFILSAFRFLISLRRNLSRFTPSFVASRPASACPFSSFSLSVFYSLLAIAKETGFKKSQYVFGQ